MDTNMYSLLNGKDPKCLNDIIELVDGTRIPGIILKVSNDAIQYFSGQTETRERVPAENIWMVYIDNATISIPFPLGSPKQQSLKKGIR